MSDAAQGAILLGAILFTFGMLVLDSFSIGERLAIIGAGWALIGAMLAILGGRR